jgi:hypothetical protein
METSDFLECGIILNGSLKRFIIKADANIIKQ